MRRASRAFFLAFFALIASSNVQARSGSQPKSACAIDPDSIVSDTCASYETLDGLSTVLNPLLEDVTQSDFFSYYRLNLYNRECPYWDDSTAACGNIACAVSTVDEEQLPEAWRQSWLSKLQGRKAEHPDRQKQAERGSQKPLQGDLGDNVDESCVVEYDDECDERDYCIPEDAGSPGKGDYVSLLDNVERFTGYGGDHAHSVWDSIYRENCFTKPEPAKLALSNPLAPLAVGGLGKGALTGPGGIQSLFVPDDSCMEKRVFYRLISGMHASISTHICHEYLNRTTGVWGPNLGCYKERLHSHPDRISNLYFNYALVSRAVAKLVPYLPAYTFCGGDPAQDAATKQKVLALAQTAAAEPAGFDEHLMFRDPGMLDLKKDFRMRFRNVSRIMDCVGCDKCRLWGKLQTNGYGTALKVLFEFHGYAAPAYDSQPLKRTELVSLINTFARLGKSMAALAEFRELMHTEDVASQPPDPSSISSGQGRGRSPSGLTVGSSSSSSASTGVGSERIAEAVKSKRNKSHFASAHQVGGSSGSADEARHAREEPAKMDQHLTPSGSEYVDYQESQWDVSMREIRLIYVTCIWVMKQWVNAPRNMLLIVLYQINRLWSWWLGLYVDPPLDWGWQDAPQRDEL